MSIDNFFARCGSRFFPVAFIFLYIFLIPLFLYFIVRTGVVAVSPPVCALFHQTLFYLFFIFVITFNLFNLLIISLLVDSLKINVNSNWRQMIFILCETYENFLLHVKYDNLVPQRPYSPRQILHRTLSQSLSETMTYAGVKCI